MTTNQRGILTLIRSALTGEKLPLPQDFSLEEADKLIRSQTLLPLCYQGAYLCGQDPKSEIMQSWQKDYFRYLIRSQRQLTAVNKITQAFDAAGIDYLPLKGCVMKPLYPQPELRVMGDADILIRLEQYDRIKPIMTRLGFVPVKESSYDLVWQNDSLYLELHKSVMSPAEKDLFRYFGDGWQLARQERGGHWQFSPEDTFAYIFTHMAKHFRFCGIGARQVVDLWVYRRAHPEMEEEKILETMERMHLGDFYRNILRLLSVWFADAPTDDVTDFITEYIFSSGNFGSTENKMRSEAVIRENGGESRSRASSLKNLLFPRLYIMQLSYNVLYRAPWLLPVMWVYRWFDVLLHRRRNILRRFRTAGSMTQDTVDSHRRMLNYMGLEYHYEEE